MKLKIPKVGLVGRPNVGKSSLFNYLTRTRDALVKDQPGVTRDLKFKNTEWWGFDFQLCDMGGWTEAEDVFSGHIRKQVKKVLNELDFLIFIMDAKAGMTPEDRMIYKICHESKRPFACVVNKIDTWGEKDMLLADFYEFGEELFPISIENQAGVDDVLEEVIRHFPKQEEDIEDDEFLEKRVRISIVGKPNVGKSSLINFFTGTESQMVTPIEGTTIDSNDFDCLINDKPFTFIDTAGIRKSFQRDENVLGLSMVKTYESIDRCDLVLLLIDMHEGPTKQDTQILEYCVTKNKTPLIVFNKLDYAEEHLPAARKTTMKRVEEVFHFYRSPRYVYISALTGKGIKQLENAIMRLWDDLNRRVPTSKLNDFFYDTIRKAPAPVYGTKIVKFYYLTQTKQKPPSFYAFTNFPEALTTNYSRFLKNQIQDHFGYGGIPIRIYFKKSK